MGVQYYLDRIAACIKKMQALDTHSPEFYFVYQEYLHLEHDFYLAIAEMCREDKGISDAYEKAIVMWYENKAKPGSMTLLENEGKE